MKKFKDIKIGDTVYVYSRTPASVEKYTVTYIDEFDINNPHGLYHIGYDLVLSQNHTMILYNQAVD